MITLRKLVAENAGPYDRLSVDLDNQGLVFLIGENEETGGSNGSGKTTPFDLIEDTLFGATAKGEKKDALVNWHHPERGLLTEVQLSIVDDDYLIRKARRHPRYGTSIHVFKNGTPITKKSMPSAERQIREEVLGLARQDFLNTTYLTNHFTHLLITGKPAERDMYLSQLFGLNLYQELATLVGADLKEIKETLAHVHEAEVLARTLRQQLDELGTPPSKEAVRNAEARVAKVQARLEALQAEHKRAVVIAQNQARRDSLQEQIEKLQLPASLPRLTKVARKLKRAVALLQQARDAALFAQQRQTIKRKLAELPVDDALDQEALKETVVKLEDRLDALKEREPEIKRRAKLEQEAAELKRQTAGARGVHDQLRETTATMGALRAQNLDLQQRLRILEKSSSAQCPTCGHEIKDRASFLADLRQRCKRIDKEQRELETERVRLEKLDALIIRLVNLKGEIEKLPEGDSEQAHQLIAKTKNSLEAARVQLAAVEQRTQLKEQLRALPTADEFLSVPDLEGKVERLSKLHTALRAHAELQHDLAALLPLKTTARSVDEISAATSKAQEKLLRAQRTLEEAQRARKEWKHARRKVVAAEDEVATMNKTRDEELALEGLQVAFGRKGLRLQRLRAIIKVIAEALPLYLGFLFGNKKLRIEVSEQEDSFSLAAFDRSHNARLSGFSAGEKARLTLALLLATRLATPPAKQSNVLIIDEVFDAIDVKGYEGVFHALRHVLSSQNVSTIFVISQHSNVAQQYSKFIDQVWLARKNLKGASQLLLGTGA